MNTNPEAAETHVFFDLEDTCIDPVMSGWRNTRLINQAKVWSVLESFRPQHIHIFSFALRTQEDLAGFRQWVLPDLEDLFGQRVKLTPTMDRIKERCCETLGLSTSKVDLTDVSEFWGKQEAFRLYVRGHFTGLDLGKMAEVILVDDMVIDELWTWNKPLLKGHIINIDNM
jgi:hypothetical protein